MTWRPITLPPKDGAPAAPPTAGTFLFMNIGPNDPVPSGWTVIHWSKLGTMIGKIADGTERA